jgi:plastocyanin
MKRILLAFIIACAMPAAAATVSGKVNFISKRGQNPTVSETLVWLEPAGGKVIRKSPATFQMMTRGKMLIPHVLAIPNGSTIEFPNDDPISHNLFSLSAGNSFDLGLYRKGAGKSEKFDSPGLVNVYCNVHPNMSSVIHVMATPFYVFSDPAGNYALTDVPPGKYKLVAWNEIGGQTETPIEVSTSGAVSGTLSVTLDSRNYRATQHLNKNGKPYEAPSLKDY